MIAALRENGGSIAAFLLDQTGKVPSLSGTSIQCVASANNATFAARVSLPT